jgi:hypothetical protein
MGIEEDIKETTKEERKQLFWYTFQIIFLCITMISVGYMISHEKTVGIAEEFVNENCYDEMGNKYGEVIYNNETPMASFNLPVFNIEGESEK